MKLYELTAEYRAAAVQLADLDIDEQTFADTLESLSGDLDQKVENIAKLILDMRGDGEKAETEAKRLAERARTIKARMDRLKDYLKINLISADRKKVETPFFVVSVRDNPASVIVDDEQEIPSAYFTDPPKPAPQLDKKLVYQAIKDGNEVPGAHLERGTSLIIK